MGDNKYDFTYAYDTHNASELQATNYTLISTIACETNAFDEESSNMPIGPKDPCMSEALIRSKDSGVIGYLGNSREGIISGTSIARSPAYEAKFYEILFGDVYKSKNFGKLVAYVKSHMGAQRYILLEYPLNPVGDAEMPIYTQIPNEFGDFTLHVRNNHLVFATETDGCQISISDNDDWSDPMLFVTSGELPIEKLPDNATLCVTKQNFKPLLFNLRKIDEGWDVYNEVPLKEGFELKFVGRLWNDDLRRGISMNLTNPVTLSDLVFQDDVLHIGIEGKLESNSSYDIMLQSAIGAESRVFPVFDQSNDVRVGALSKGMYVVVLTCNGVQVDTKKCWIK